MTPEPRYAIQVECAIHFQHRAEALLCRYMEQWIRQHGTGGHTQYHRNILPLAPEDRQYVAGYRVY